jgi:hypothetical protein
MMGLTMALIAVLIAFCAALVGSERNEFTRFMIKQTQANSDYIGASTKFRLIMLELEKQRGSIMVPDSHPTNTPTMRRFLQLYLDYSKEERFSKAWADSYEPLTSAHFEAAEGYEKAQLVAEIAIILASLGVLLANRTAWLVSIAVAALCVVQLGRTSVKTRQVVHQTHTAIAQAEEAYQQLRKQHAAANEDAKTVEQLDPGGKVRAALEADRAKPIASPPTR